MSSAHNFEDRAVELFTSWSKRRTYFRAFHGHIVSQGWTSEFHTSPRRTVASPQKHPIVPKGYQSFTILRHHCLPLPMGVKDAISDIYWNYLWDQIFPTIHFASNTTNDSFWNTLDPIATLQICNLLPRGSGPSLPMWPWLASARGGSTSGTQRYTWGSLHQQSNDCDQLRIVQISRNIPDTMTCHDSWFIFLLHIIYFVVFP